MSLAIGATGLKAKPGLDSATERALVDQCRRQDFDAFGKVVDAYEGRILGFVRRMVSNPEEALDVTQEVFIKAFQGFKQFDGRSSLRTWLFRIAHNLCVDRARKQDRSPQEYRIDANEGDTEAWEVSDNRWNPETLVLDEEMHRVLENGIAAMSEKLRSVLLLHDREDMGYDEIAQMLDIPVGTVKSRLFLARNHLQNFVGSYLKGEA